jgi:hypothetical protein
MAVCIPNISRTEQRKRLYAGIVQSAIASLVAAGLRATVNRWWRLAVFPLFWGAAAGFWQWRDKT